MGRNKQEGQKNLKNCVGNPRYTQVFFSKNGNRLPAMWVSNASYDRIVDGFARRGWNVVDGSVQP